MNPITEEQARAALVVAGIEALDKPAAIAASVSALLAGTAKAFESLPFEAEPCSFFVVQTQGRADE